jgi:ribosomal protein S27AE
MRAVDLDEKVIATFYSEECEEWTQQTTTIEDVLDSVCDDYTVLPSAQLERKKGQWILSDDREWKTCSECGAEVDVSMGTGVYVGLDAVDELRFCPNCGAMMLRGEQDG